MSVVATIKAPVQAVFDVFLVGTGSALVAPLQTRLMDVAADCIDRGLATIRRNYESSVKRGRLSTDDVDRRLARIQTGVGYNGCAGAERGF